MLGSRFRICAASRHRHVGLLSMEEQSPKQNADENAEDSGSDNEEQVNNEVAEEAVKTFKDLVGLFPQRR